MLKTSGSGLTRDGFIYGVATSAFQIEGATDRDGRGPSIWDEFTNQPGKIHNGDDATIASQHYDRVEEDIALLRELGVTAYRFSISWSRVQPTGEGEFNPAGIAFYRHLIESLTESGIRPFVTLYHWDLPQHLQLAGGWTNRNTAQKFADYAERMVAEFHEHVHDWITINEPWCAAFLGHNEGMHAPGIQDEATAVRAAHHLLLAHGLATRQIKNLDPSANVGISLLLSAIEPASSSALDIQAARHADGEQNRWWLDAILNGCYPPDMIDCYAGIGATDVILPGDLDTISHPIEFLGVNYYFRHVVASDLENGRRTKNLEGPTPRTAMGESVDHEGLAQVLERLRDAYRSIPILITEFGAPFADYVDPRGAVLDGERVNYLESQLAVIESSVAQGVDVRGIFVWSLLDNFEWSFGYSLRFGLYYVEYATGTRIPKASAKYVRAWIQRHRESNPR